MRNAFHPSNSFPGASAPAGDGMSQHLNSVHPKTKEEILWLRAHHLAELESVLIRGADWDDDEGFHRKVIAALNAQLRRW